MFFASYVLSEDCDVTIRSTDHGGISNGTFMSPDWPDNYGDQLRCIYKFIGRPDQRVSVKFLHFDVKGIPPRSV